MIRKEMSKILSWRKLLCLLGFAVIYYLLFLRPYVAVHPGSYHQCADIALAASEKYGGYLSAEEFEDLKSNAPKKGTSEIDKMIAANPLFQTYNFHTFQEFNDGLEHITEAESTELFMELYDTFSDSQVSNEFTRMIELNYNDDLMDTYKKEALHEGIPDNQTEYYDDLNAAQEKRLEERNKKEVYGILPAEILHDNFEVLQFFSAFMIISILFVLLPYMVQENRSNMPLLQYSLRKGRRFYWYKLAACFGSALIIAVIEFLLYLLTAKVNQVLDFWNAPAASFGSGYIGWFPWSLGTTTLMVFLFTLAVSLGAAMILSSVTRYCRNYVTALAWSLPLLIGAGVYGGYCIHKFTEITQWKYLVPCVSFAVFGIGAVVVLIQFAAERKRNID